MQTFQFQITQQYVSPALKIISPYWVEVNYEVVDNKVVVLDVKIPYVILTYLTGYNLANDIYFAAEHNALELKIQKTEMQFDIFKELGTFFNPKKVHS